MNEPAVVFAEAGAAELVCRIRFRSQRSIKIAMKTCMAETEGILKDEKSLNVGNIFKSNNIMIGGLCPGA